MRSIQPKAIVLGILVLASGAAAAEQINVATPTHGLIELPIIVAIRNRYFASEGLDIRKIQIEPEVAVKALVAGHVDVNLAWDASLRSAISGTAVKLVATTASRPLSVLIARPEIRSGRDLKGKTLGVDALFSTTDHLTRVALRYLGIQRDTDVSVVEVGNSAVRLNELRAGSIHAAVVDGVSAVRAEEDGLKRLVQLGDIVELPMFGVAVATKKLAERRQQVKRFIRATLRGTRFIKQSRADAVRIIQTYLKVTPRQAVKAYDLAVSVFTDDGLISDRLLALSIWRGREGLSIADEPMLNKVADWSVLREILADRRKTPLWLRRYDP